ncbi:MAG: hypothetical protein IJM62_06190 [Lachnospiraceae bacterium]|nr:hypothetical protein [Lachnospiraceae bacterium]
MKTLKKIAIPAAVFIVAFVAAIFIFRLILNRSSDENEAVSEGADMPVITADIDGYEINRLYGFRSSVSPGTLRDSIVPFTGDTMKFRVTGNISDIKSITYTITSVDTQERIEKGKITKFDKEEDGLSFTVDTEGKAEKGVEYCLTFNIQKAGDVNYYYYTRLIQGINPGIKRMLRFATDFSDKTFDKSLVSTVASYMIDTGASSTDLSDIGITATGELLVWYGMYPNHAGDVHITIKDMDEKSMQIVLRYLITTDAIEESNNTYSIYEYYYLQYDTEEEVMNLLSYNRTMSPAYDMGTDAVDENGIALGITDEKNISWREAAGEDSHYIAFTHGTNVYLYDLKDNVLCKAFGFSDALARSMYNTKILRVNTDGSMYFLVYGYMPGGMRAGSVGTSLYKYTMEDNACREIVYIPSNKAYPRLIREMDRLSFMSGDGQLYVMAGDNVYNIDYDGREYISLISGLSNYDYAVSGDGMQLALYNNDTAEGLKGYRIINLDDGQIKEITLPEGEKGISFIGFYGNDIVYAMVAEMNNVEDGGLDLYYKEVDIVDKDFNVLKVYRKEGELLTGIVMDENSIRIDLMKKEGSAYKKTGTEYLLNNRPDTDGDVSIKDVYNRTMGTVKYLGISDDDIPDTDPIFLTARELKPESNDVLSITELENAVYYYVHSGGTIADEFSDPSKAINYCKDVPSGSVTDTDNRVIWENTSLSGYRERFIQSIRQGDMQGEIIRALMRFEDIEGDPVINRNKSMGENMEANLKDKKIIRLTGLTLDDVLYFVDKGHPVVGKYKDGGYVLIVGYDYNYFYGADPETGEIMDWNRESYSEEFEAQGNIFITYY